MRETINLKFPPTFTAGSDNMTIPIYYYLITALVGLYIGLSDMPFWKKAAIGFVWSLISATTFVALNIIWPIK